MAPGKKMLANQSKNNFDIVTKSDTQQDKLDETQHKNIFHSHCLDMTIMHQIGIGDELARIIR